MTIDYDASALSGWKGARLLFLRYHGTILAGLFHGPMFWVPNVLHVLFCAIGGQFTHNNHPEAASANDPVAWAGPSLGSTELKLTWQMATVSLPLLFFFIVFYNNNSYSRFYTLYGHTVGLGANIMEWTALIKLHTVPSDRAGRWNSVRLMLAAMNMLYYSLFGGDMEDSEWARIVERNLLSYDEVLLLKPYKGFKPFLAVFWALEEAQNLVAKKSSVLMAKIPEHLLPKGAGAEGIRAEHIHSQFRDVAFAFRGHCGQIINLLKQPVPFP